MTYKMVYKHKQQIEQSTSLPNHIKFLHLYNIIIIVLLLQI